MSEADKFCKSKAVVADLISAVAEIDALLAAKIQYLSTFDKNWHIPKEEIENTRRRLDRRIKSWRQLTSRVGGEGSALARDAEFAAKIIERVASIRHDLAHGRISYSSSDFGDLVKCTVKRPASFIILNAETGDPDVDFDVIFTRHYLRMILNQAQTVRGFVDRIYWDSEAAEQQQRQDNH